MITQRPHRFTSSPWAALSVAGLLLAVLAIGGCSDDAAVGGPATASSSSGKAASSEPGGDNGTGQTAVPAGQLTAGDWDDNLNFDLFTAYLESAQALVLLC